jgi:hypothetical protein
MTTNMLFIVGEKIIKIEHLGMESKALVWRLGKNTNGEWLWKFEHDDRIQYESHQLSIGSYLVINDDPNKKL